MTSEESSVSLPKATLAVVVVFFRPLLLLLSLRLVVFLGPRVGNTKLTNLSDSAAGTAGKGPPGIARLSTDGMVWH